MSPAAPRSPEAGGELARGLQAGVAGGGDFILGANLPAGRKAHKKLITRPGGGWQGDVQGEGTEEGTSPTCRRPAAPPGKSRRAPAPAAAAAGAGPGCGPAAPSGRLSLPSAPRRLCPPRPAAGLRRPPLLPPRRWAAPRRRQMCPRGGAAPAQMCLQMWPPGGAGPRQMRWEGVAPTPCPFPAPRVRGARGKVWGGGGGKIQGGKVMGRGRSRSRGWQRSVRRR